MLRYNPNIHRRRSIRLQDYDYREAGAYFVTLCVVGKQCLFGDIVDSGMMVNTVGEIAIGCWLAIPEHFPSVELDTWVVMPNHIHGIIVIAQTSATVGATYASPLQMSGPRSGSVGAIVGSFKSAASKHINRLRQTPGEVLWQRNYYEHIIRNESDLDRIRFYIENNPSRWIEDTEYPGK